MSEASGSLPTGTVTFVLSDVVGSTAMWDARPEAAAETIAALDGIVSKLVDEHMGAKPVEQGEGDSFVAAFARAADAARFAVALQRSLATVAWPDDVQPALRLALHTGEARLQDGLYRGESLNRCARIRALAHGGQILLSGTTAELVVDGLSDDMFLKDIGVHRLRDLSRPEHLRQLCDPHLPMEFPPLLSLDHLPNNLPLQLTSFIGRDTEMAEVAELLATQRLVTLTGAGGSGKTRLALQVAANLVDRGIEGSWLVDLAPVSDPQLVGRAIATVLGVHEMPLQDVSDALETWLHDRRVLLLVDNCEHLIDECATIVARLLAACPQLRMLATSREPIGVSGETAYRVPSLQLPRDESVECASVDLFAARAVAVRPSFRVGPENADAIASICRRLDGLPLAIELAAARCRALSPQQIANQLVDRFSLLSGGTRTALPRQRTLEASVSWSVDLLTDDERSLLRRLSVFSGTFSLEAAEAVGSLDQDDSWQVVEMLTGLVDKSLVQIEEDAHAVRYRLLETVRHFAAQQLVASGEMETTRDVHAEYYLRFVEPISAQLVGVEAAARHAELDRDQTNVWNALAWLVHTQRGDAATLLAARLSRVWQRTASREILDALERVLAVDGGTARDRAMVMLSCGEVAWQIGDLESNTRYIDALEEYARAHDLDEMVEYPNLFRGWRGMLLGDPNTLDLLRSAGHRLRDRGDFFWSADAFIGGAAALMERGDCLGAEQLYVEAEIDARRSTDPIAIARVLVTHAGNKMNLGELATAQEMLDDVAVQQLVAPDKTVELLGRAYRAWIDIARGNHDEGIQRADLVAEGSLRGGLPVQFAWSRWVSIIGRRACLRRDGLDARLEETAQLMDLVGLPWGTVWCTAVRAELALDQGEHDEARALVDAALAFGRSHEFVGFGVIRGFLTKARVLRAADEDGAEDDAHEALALSAAGGLHLDTIEALELLASFAAERGDAEQAARVLGSTRRIRDETGAPVPPVLQREIEDTLAAAAATLGDEAFSEALARGAGLGLSDAIAYAQRGRGSRRRPATGWRSLTPSEIQVVELVAEGCTNAEVASRLFISVPTVKTHLSHVFTKLSVSTRAELAAQAARRA